MHTIRNKQGGNTDNDFWAQWSSVNPRMALFIKVIPASETLNISTIGFTSNSRDMTLPGHGALVFKSVVGITPSVVEQKLNEAANMELQGIYADGIFEREQVVNGLWDYAKIEVFSACWDDPDLGELVHFSGTLGDFKDYQLSFTAEARGLISRLSSDAGVVTTRYCRVREFGDAQCGFSDTTLTIDGDPYSIQAVITQARVDGTSRRTLVVDSSLPGVYIPVDGGDPAPTGFFNNGLMTGTGDNVGVVREILSYENDGGLLTFKLKRPFPIEINDPLDFGFIVKAGCNRTLENCRKYNNVINFRGEPFIPGFEAMNRIPPGT